MNFDHRHPDNVFIAIVAVCMCIGIPLGLLLAWLS
jgi:hypothetical protein